MQIYFIGQKGIPATIGGVEHYVDSAATLLAARGHDVFVYTRWNYSNKKRKSYCGVNLINLPSIPTKNLDTITHTFLAVLDVLRRPADVVHFHSIGPSLLLWVVKIFKPGTVVVGTFQSQCYRHQKWGSIARFFLHLGEIMLCAFADVVIVPSKILYHYAARRYSLEPVYLPNGVTMQKKQPAKLIKKFGLKKDNYILYAGRLIRHKGVHYLIEAYKELPTDKKLVIVGSGSFTNDYIKELKELAGKNKNIIFTGQQNGQILRELYSNAHCFVQPSESEGLSIALLEAMSYGLPVVASDISENKEALAGNGYLFANADVKELEQALKNVLSREKSAKRAGAKAREHIKQNYNWNVLARDLASLYKKAVNLKQEHKFINKKLIANLTLEPK
ncbi:MAG: glycosyltransferase family 4 protein [Patescibacteria group bacterium]|jgi:glycosyltransferase involved in cell wall biosynthesis